MKINTIFTSTLLMSIFFCQQSNAAFRSGNDLYESYAAYLRDRSGGGVIEDSMKSSFLMGYIAAQADISHRLEKPLNSCIPWGSNGVTVGQVVDIVGKYLKENPNLRNKDGGTLSAVALRLEFPCDE